MCSHGGKSTYAQDKQKSCGGRRQTTAAGTTQEAGNPLCLGRQISGLDRHASWPFPVTKLWFHATDRLKISRDSLSRCTHVAFSNDDAVMNS